MKRLLALALLLPLAGAARAAESAHWAKVAADIGAVIAQAEAQAVAGNPDEAKKTVTQAYFGVFESSKMEAAIRKEIGAKPAYEREKLFADLRKAITKGDSAVIRQIAAALRTGLAEDGKALD
ncbi:MAG TPA: hypothetical protein VLL76_05200, partial [Candidatus Omnitrophota bacterium]|nr:hypothetical protein [Candidatus Omnitrophota bacterium]